MRLIKDYLNYQDYQTQVFYFLPDEIEEGPLVLALFSHGYTADKSSILNWALRLVESGVSCALFDLPGHYLGNFSEVVSFDHFKNHAHEIFSEAFKGLKNTFLKEFPLNDYQFENEETEIILGGHSLGAMLSIKALELSVFKKFKRRCIGVGIGMAPKNVVHLFDTPFYRSTLLVREQLVSPELTSKNVFPWIKEEKENVKVKGETIHLISGVDDLVVGEDGMERFADVLMSLGNFVSMEKPTRLPHHEPNLAAGHIKKYLKSVGVIKNKN